MGTNIRRITVELLRSGPRHNQLLSPLTNYLAVCGQFPAGVVNVAYEQMDILDVLEELRYDVSSAERASRLASVRDRTGAELARLLGSVPGLPGALSAETRDPAVLTHLRIVLSAAELALLPFELTRVPVGGGAAGLQWLALRPGQPVCVTRHVRAITETDGNWPVSPRILFVAGRDVPFERHLDVLARVLAPWQEVVPPEGPDRIWSSGALTVIRDASLDDVMNAAAATSFTHVHVLAHGAEESDRHVTRYGIALADRVVFGEQLATALSTPVRDGVHLPTVVTLASCDSAAQGSVVTPTGSVAHDLHASGIRLVVASQFPISEDASVPFLEEFLSGELRGEHPLVSLHRVRRRLDAGFSEEHAWASIVAYESIPDNLEDQLEEVRYWQARRALDHALGRLEQEVGALCVPGRSNAPDIDLDDYFRAVAVARAALPDGGPFRLECGGLRAASWKRTAEALFRLAQADETPLNKRAHFIAQSRVDLETALTTYHDVLAEMLTTHTDAHRKATVHWLAVQVLMLQFVLGHVTDGDLRSLAKYTASLDAKHSDRDVRAWAHASLTELALLKLAIDGPGEYEATAADALVNARRIAELTGRDSEQAFSTRRQMSRYIHWWGSEAFNEMISPAPGFRTSSWQGEHGVVATAERIVKVLAGNLRAPASGTALEGASTSTRDRQLTHPRSTNDESEGAPEARRGNFDIEMLPAGHGDCIWISYGEGNDQRHLLFDCGTTSAAELAAERIRAGSGVEVFVLTHIDADHISGAIPLLSEHSVGDRIADVWFNGWRQLRKFLSVRQGEQFSAILERDDRRSLWNHTEPGDQPPQAIQVDEHDLPSVELPGGMQLTVLSPTRTALRRLASHWQSALSELDPSRAMLAQRMPPRFPADPETLDLEQLARSGPTRDASVSNGSSIAVLAEFGGRAVLFTGDAHADVLVASIRSLQAQRGRPGKPLRLDALKLSHHGSANATTAELLQSIECPAYLVSTDGGRYYHPDSAAIARVAVYGGPAATLCFNYRSEFNGVWESSGLQAKYQYATRYPDGDQGLNLTL